MNTLARFTGLTGTAKVHLFILKSWLIWVIYPSVSVSLSVSSSLFLCLSCLFTTQRWTTSVMGTACPNSFFPPPPDSASSLFSFFFLTQMTLIPSVPISSSTSRSSFLVVFFVSSNWLKSAWDHGRSDVLVRCCRFRPVIRQGHV